MQPATGKPMMMPIHHHGRPVFSAWYAKQNWISRTDRAEDRHDGKYSPGRAGPRRTDLTALRVGFVPLSHHCR